MALTTYSGTISTPAARDTKGAYTQLVASTPYASSRVHLHFGSAGAISRLFLVDLATGAAGVETVVVANLAVHVDTEAIACPVTSVSVDVPAGSRLAVRAQHGTITAAQILSCWLYLEDRALGSLAAPVTYGANTSNTTGTSIDPGPTITTKGSYVQLSASTSARIDALVLTATVNFGNLAMATFTEWNLDLATGGAGSETIIVSDLHFLANNASDKVRPDILRLPVSIAAGTRLAVRCSCNRNTATERLLMVTVIGMQEPATGGGGGAAGAVAYVG